MKTDVTLENLTAERRIVIETKFTDALVVGPDYGKNEPTLNSGYLYQLYTYLTSQDRQDDPIADHAEGILLFVQTFGSQPFTEEAEIQGHRMRFMSVDLGATPAEIRARWMQCVTPVDKVGVVVPPE